MLAVTLEYNFFFKFPALCKKTIHYFRFCYAHYLISRSYIFATSINSEILFHPDAVILVMQPHFTVKGKTNSCRLHETREGIRGVPGN